MSKLLKAALNSWDISPSHMLRQAEAESHDWVTRLASYPASHFLEDEPHRDYATLTSPSIRCISSVTFIFPNDLKLSHAFWVYRFISSAGGMPVSVEQPLPHSAGQILNAQRCLLIKLYFCSYVTAPSCPWGNMTENNSYKKNEKKCTTQVCPALCFTDNRFNTYHVIQGLQGGDW